MLSLLKRLQISNESRTNKSTRYKKVTPVHISALMVEQRLCCGGVEWNGVELVQ